MVDDRFIIAIFIFTIPAVHWRGTITQFVTSWKPFHEPHDVTHTPITCDAKSNYSSSKTSIYKTFFFSKRQDFFLFVGLDCTQTEKFRPLLKIGIAAQIVLQCNLKFLILLNIFIKQFRHLSFQNVSVCSNLKKLWLVSEARDWSVNS